MNNIETSEFNEIKSSKRSKFLTVLCILSFVMCGLKVGTCLLNIYQSTPEVMQGNIEKVRAVNPEMADQMENSFIEMQQNTYLKLSPYFEMLFTLLSFLGILMMWNLKKNGFYFYSIAEILPYISLFFINSKSMSIPGFSAESAASIMIFMTALMIAIDLLFVYLYYRNIEEMDQ